MGERWADVPNVPPLASHEAFNRLRLAIEERPQQTIHISILQTVELGQRARVKRA